MNLKLYTYKEVCKYDSLNIFKLIDENEYGFNNSYRSFGLNKLPKQVQKFDVRVLGK